MTYIVTIYDEAGEVVAMETINATANVTSFNFERRNASLLCQELTLSVTATNIVGESIPGRVLWEFPIGKVTGACYSLFNNTSFADIGDVIDMKSEVAVVLLLDGSIQVSIGFNVSNFSAQGTASMPGLGL